jgi:hypothetical protein
MDAQHPGPRLILPQLLAACEIPEVRPVTLEIPEPGATGY